MTNRNRDFRQNSAHMLIGAMRKTFYGPSFARGCADNERLIDVLAKDASLRQVIRDHEAGTLERISRSWRNASLPQFVCRIGAPQMAAPGPGPSFKAPQPQRWPGPHLPEVIPTMGVNARYRDKGGEISRKHGDTLIGALRISYGSRFAKDCADDEKLSEVLAKLDEPSLFKLVRDHKAGMLPIRLSSFLASRHGG